MAAGSHIGFDLGNVRPPTKCNCRSQLVLKFGVDAIYSFGDVVIFIFCRFGLKLPIYAHFGEFLGIFSPNVVTHRFNHVISSRDHPCAETCRLSHKV